jgi:hypothetical protein
MRGAVEVSGQLQARPLYLQEKSPWYPLGRRLGGLQSRSGRGSEEKNSQPLPGLEPPIIQPVAQRYTAEPSRLLKLYWKYLDMALEISPYSSRWSGTECCNAISVQ